jgi:TonB family protein
MANREPSPRTANGEPANRTANAEPNGERRTTNHEPETMDAVSPILIERAREPEGLRNMFAVSIVVHAVVAVAIVVAPHPAPDAAPATVMSISLGGAPGPRSGGMTPMAGRAAEAVKAAEKPATVAPPAPKPAEMVLPKQVKTPPKPTQKTAPADARGRTVAKAAEASQGDARVETGAKTTGFGLTTGGGGTSGYLDVQNFCCPEYLGTMIQLIQRNWNGRQNVQGATMVKFTIQRDGRLTNIELEKSSGYFALDQTAQRSLLLTRQLPPLPGAFSEPTLTVHLNFQYEP